MSEQLEMTPRGFRIFDRIEDLYGNRIRVQESSLAGQPAVWLYITDRSEHGIAGGHFTPELAERLMRALNVWLASVRAAAAPVRSDHE